MSEPLSLHNCIILRRNLCEKLLLRQTQEIFQSTLIPNVKKLQRELEQHFQPYVLS